MLFELLVFALMMLVNRIFDLKNEKTISESQ